MTGLELEFAFAICDVVENVIWIDLELELELEEGFQSLVQSASVDTVVVSSIYYLFILFPLRLSTLG